MVIKEDKEQDLFDITKEREVRPNSKIIQSEQTANDRTIIKGRPNIDEIVSRNAEQEKQERKFGYKITGIIIIIIIAIMLLIYFFN